MSYLKKIWRKFLILWFGTFKKRHPYRCWVCKKRAKLFLLTSKYHNSFWIYEPCGHAVFFIDKVEK